MKAAAESCVFRLIVRRSSNNVCENIPHQPAGCLDWVNLKHKMEEKFSALFTSSLLGLGLPTAAAATSAACCGTEEAINKNNYTNYNSCASIFIRICASSKAVWKLKALEFWTASSSTTTTSTACDQEVTWKFSLGEKRTLKCAAQQLTSSHLTRLVILCTTHDVYGVNVMRIFPSKINP